MKINFIAKYKVEGIEHYCTLDDCLSYISELKMVGIDIETSRKYKKGEYDERVYKGGLDPYLSNICMLQLGDDKETFVIDVRDFTNEEMKPIINFLDNNKDVTFVGHNCLPKSTEVLTSRGWKKIAEVTNDDYVFGYNNGYLETQKVNSTVQKKDTIITLKNKGRKFSSTPDHRWLVETRYGDLKYLTTKELSGTRNKIILNGDYIPVSFSKLTDSELKIFTWAITDGTIKFNKSGLPNRIEITQSLKNKILVQEIKNLFESYYGIFKEYNIKTTNYSDCKRFCANAFQTRLITDKINFNKNFDFVKFVLSLNKRQLQIFIDTYHKAEGNKRRRKGDLLRYCVTKNTPSKRDAIALAIYLSGKTVSFNEDSVFAKQSIKADCRSLKETHEGEQEVFCLSVPFSNFVVRQEEKIFITGNCRFEALHLKHKYGIRFRTIWDTMLAEMCLFNGMTLKFGLADLAERYLGVEKAKDILLFEDTVDSRRLTMNERHLEKHDSFFTPFEVAENFQIDKSTRLEFVTLGDKPFTEKQILYGADDIVMPLLIRQRQRIGRKLENGEVYNPHKWQKVENRYCLVLADMQLNGMHVRKDLWKKLHDENFVVYLKRKKVLDNYVVNNYGDTVAAQYNLFNTEEQDCPVQWTSSKQVVTFFKKLKICPRAYSSQTKEVEYTVGAMELLKTLPNPLKIAYERDKDEDIVDLDTLKLAYLLFKKSEQAITTFGEPWLKYVHPITGRAHSNYRQILNTARISSTNPNLNNISGGKWRDCFEVGEGLTMVNLDYSSQEVRVLAEVCRDETLMNFFIKGDETFGDDFHSFTATKVYSMMEDNPTLLVPPKEIMVEGDKVKNPKFTHEDSDKRGNSKKVTFGLAYGKGVRGFSEDLGITEEEAEELIQGYMDAFPGLQDHFDNCERNANIYDFVMINEKLDVRWFCDFFMDIKKFFNEAMAYFPPDYQMMRKAERDEFKKELYKANPQIKQLFSKAGRLKGSLARKNKNYPIQGSSSMMLKIAMVMFREWCIDNDKDWKVIGNIYDEVLLEVLDEEVEEAGVKIKECMESGGHYICPTVPQIANAVYSKVWEH